MTGSTKEWFDIVYTSYDIPPQDMNLEYNADTARPADLHSIFAVYLKSINSLK